MRRSKGTVDETYDVAIGGAIMASGLAFGDAEKLAAELAAFLDRPRAARSGR